MGVAPGLRYFGPSLPSQLPAAEADRVALRVEDREQDPAAEEVLLATPPVDRARARCRATSSSLEAQHPGQLVPARRAPTRAGTCRTSCRRDAPASGGSPGPGRRRRPDSRRLVVPLAPPVPPRRSAGDAACATRPRRRRCSAATRPPGRQPLDRADEVEALELPDERDGVAASSGSRSSSRGPPPR